ncbi:MAG: carboxypeptidase regulatory-like domain-containing protein [Chloracidobacterium sp.]|nr:carboxypeptidase regulatory-like domain-containing protein [Chloracidobacterium sp.]
MRCGESAVHIIRSGNGCLCGRSDGARHSDRDIHECSGDAIAGVVVRCTGSAAVTDRSGNFILNACTAQIVVTADGFEPATVVAAGVRFLADAVRVDVRIRKAAPIGRLDRGVIPQDRRLRSDRTRTARSGR